MRGRSDLIDPTPDGDRRRLSINEVCVKRIITVIVVLVVLLGGAYGVNAIFSTSADVPTATVLKDEFVISLKASGTVDAKRAFTISAPRVRGLQITWLAPEGSVAKEGDPIIRFDATQQTADLNEFQSSLKIAQTTLERSKKEYTIQEKQLTLEVQKAQRKYDEMKHEAPALAEEARLELELAELNFQARLDQIKSDMAKAELEVQRAQDKVTMAQKELAQMTMAAPIPGMVVYLEIWKGGSMGKVQEGDAPWPGQGLVNLPDLSEMIVKATASEVDAFMVDSGQAVEITLDAFPDKKYAGVVTKKGTLARKKDMNSKINVFDVEVLFLEQDEELKPGMSASANIIVDRIPDVVSVPLESVFERDGKTVVYLSGGDRRDVEVGRRNDMEIEITSGLSGGEKVCLVDPSLESQSLPGDKATEPELNQGRGQRQAPPSNPSGRRGRR
ncbi:MAG: efflux RND transporter periplasmic adaptor subunit [candidate division Zixibacteria bacterium]|jgi:RND family efflux transporter MFP subunit|nr:efflux RND transporter periplasmic adaptor subunit [candidate division Zixibacteria bacterium]